MSHVFSDLAGSSRCFESKPHGQLPSVPQPCCCGRSSFPGQQAQQPIFCPLCVPSGPFLPAWREQPLHRGQYQHLENFICCCVSINSYPCMGHFFPGALKATEQICGFIILWLLVEILWPHLHHPGEMYQVTKWQT